MKSLKLRTHFLSALAVSFFLFLAYGSDENITSNSTSTTQTDSSLNDNQSSNTSLRENVVEKINTILPFEEQQSIAKNLVARISEIENPASVAVNNCKVAMQAFLNKQMSANQVINYANIAKDKCDNAMFKYAELKVPIGFKEDTALIFKNGINHLKIAYSIKGTTYRNLINYFQTFNNDDINYYNEDMKDAESHIMLAAADIGKIYAYFNLLDEMDANSEIKSQFEDTTSAESNDTLNN